MFLAFHDYYRNDTKKTKNDGCLQELVKKVIYITKHPEKYKEKQEMVALQDTKIIEQIGHGLVQLIENGDINSPEMNQLLCSYLQPMIAADIDCLVLGCSHYPYLIPQIKKILPKHVKIIDSGEAVARQTKNVLREKVGFTNQTHKGNCLFYSNTDSKVLSDILKNKHNVITKDF